MNFLLFILSHYLSASFDVRNRCVVKGNRGQQCEIRLKLLERRYHFKRNRVETQLLTCKNLQVSGKRRLTCKNLQVEWLTCKNLQDEQLPCKNLPDEWLTSKFPASSFRSSTTLIV